LSLSGHTVEVGGFDRGVSVTAQITIALIVRKDDDKIGPIVFLCLNGIQTGEYDKSGQASDALARCAGV
jgi:hypothetical protein